MCVLSVDWSLGRWGAFHSWLSKFIQALVKSHLAHSSRPAETTPLKAQRVRHRQQSTHS